MQKQPKVSCVMPVCGRAEMTAQAIRCVEYQTYESKELIKYENAGDRTIGALRNASNALASGEIICHFDSDDWSHPNRVSEQVAFLIASGADAVGMNEMLFWREKMADVHDFLNRFPVKSVPLTQEAWLYSHPRTDRALGTSLCYWRKTWERKPFADGPKPGMPSEFFNWFRELKVVAMSSLVQPLNYFDNAPGAVQGDYCQEVASEPRMIARIHGANFGTYDLEGLIAGGSREWKRVPDWDERIRSILA
jgi:glycosyltransferase involved in cell wall biosynthesis